MAISAGAKKVYCAQYIRNKENLWIGDNTESLISVESFLKKWMHLREKWTFIGHVEKNILHALSQQKQKIDIDVPDAKDIIPFALLAIKQKKFLQSSDIHINYLNELLFR